MVPLAAADTLVDVLTVEEMLMYTAELKRPVKEGKSSKKAAVDGLIDNLGLEACRNVRIGNSMARGISGGQVRSASTPFYCSMLASSLVDCLHQYTCISQGMRSFWHHVSMVSVGSMISAWHEHQLNVAETGRRQSVPTLQLPW